jgi:predicted O-linked N-acetylglucosamine transferase (SPINDLY family)
MCADTESIADGHRYMSSRSKGAKNLGVSRATPGAALVELANRQLQEGKFADAESTARRLVASNKKSIEGWLLLAEAQRHGGRRHDAALTLREALGIAPNNALAHYRLGIVLQEVKRFAEAELAFQDAIAASGNMAEAHAELGNLYYTQGQVTEAEQCFHRAIAARPTYAWAHYLLGNLYRENGRLAPAADAYREAVKHRPDHPEAWYNLGLTERLRDLLDEAIAAYSQAVALRPTFAEALNNLGTCRRAQGRLDEAEKLFREALANKDLAMPYYNLAGLFAERARYSEAYAAYQKCAEMEPGFAGAQLDWAGLLLRRGEHAKAEELYRRLLEKHPGDRGLQLTVFDGMARLCREQLRFSEAAEFYRRRVKLDPQSAEALAGLVGTKAYLGDWRESDAEFEQLMRITDRQLAAGERTALSSFAALSCPLAPDVQLAISRTWGAETERLAADVRKQLHFVFTRRSRDRIRIAYVSSDFNNHATSHLVQGLFGAHDRGSFETYAISHGKNDASSYRKRIEADAERFVDVADMTDRAAAEAIFGAGIDILVDLNGYTQNHRLGISALRPAPIIATYLGFPGTSGAAFIDYAIVDSIVVPPAEAPLYSEKLVHLPNCYQVNDREHPIDAAPVQRRDYGLPADAVVFCCFNNNYKIEPFIFDVWMRILKQVPDSVLWLLRLTSEFADNMRREAGTRGVDPERLFFADRIGKPKHLARHRLADLFLDTRYYTAHTSCSDALWAGLPVLTCPSDTFASRVSASILRAAGLPELVAQSFEDYERRAVEWGTRPVALKAIREKWAAQRLTCALFDTARFARNIEHAYRLMWENHVAGNPPRQLSVPEDAPSPSPVNPNGR